MGDERGLTDAVVAARDALDRQQSAPAWLTAGMHDIDSASVDQHVTRRIGRDRIPLVPSVAVLTQQIGSVDARSGKFDVPPHTVDGK